MAKKGASKGEKRAVRTAKKKADAQRKTLRRQTGEVKRVEVQLNADSERDQYIAMHLNQVPYGELSEFVRCAIEEKIAREIAPPSSAPAPVQPQINLDDMRAVVKEALRGMSIKAAAGVVISFDDDQPAPVASTGLDMSGPHRRAKSGAKPSQIDAPPEEWTDAAQDRYARQLLDSIKKAERKG